MTARVFSIPETAERLAVSRNTVYRLISDGALRAVNVGRQGKPRTRVREDDLARFIDQHTEPRAGAA